MIKQMLKIAKVSSEKEFLKKYPTEASFFKAHPEAEMLKYAYGGGAYQEGGMMVPEQPAMMGQQVPAAQPSQEDMVQQILQFVIESLQQGASPEEVLQQLVEQGLSEEQAVQIIESVMQKMQEQSGGMEQSAQPTMRKGGTPCYSCGGKYKKGGSYSGTYSAGVYYANGGYLPDYSQMMFAGQDGSGELTPPGTPGRFKNGGGFSKYKKGGEYELSQAEIDKLIQQGYKIQYV